MDIAATTIRLLVQQRRAQYLSGAALVIYVYDYFLTFDREVEYVWKSRWSPVKNLFLLNRYFVIVNIIVQQFRTVSGTWGSSECFGLAQAFIFLTAFGTLLSELMLCIRLWIMWDKNKKVLVGVMAIFVAILVYYITDTEKTFHLSEASPNSPLAHPLSGCALNVHGEHAYITPIILIISDVAKVILALIPTLRMMCTPRPIFRDLLMSEVYREGVLFYVYLCIYTVADLVLVIQNADNAIAVVPVFLVIRVVLASRMVLHIRQLYTADEYTAQITGTTGRTTYM